MKYTHSFFDLDGTIYVSGKLLTGVKESLLRLVNSGTKVFYMTNNTSVSISQYYKKLQILGLPITDNCVLTPMNALSNWINSTAVSSFYAVATDEFVEELCDMTKARVSEKNPEIVIVAFDTELTYAKVQRACQFINAGVPWYVTHIDLACPSDRGPIPDCGAIAKLIEAATGVAPETDFGKPSDFMAQLIMDKVGCGDNKLLVSGDRLYTDMAMGIKLGADTVLVKTGEFFDESELGCWQGKVVVSDSLSVFLENYFENNF